MGNCKSSEAANTQYMQRWFGLNCKRLVWTYWLFCLGTDSMVLRPPSAEWFFMKVYSSDLMPGLALEGISDTSLNLFLIISFSID
ncbi:MAG: hypothetical protein IPL09_13975 [Bacteroidetes bacterium]|nr:hypothetical protein [Bacteroidota bacterium]